MAKMEASGGDISKEIKELERREADAVLRGDTAALEVLWADDLLVNSTANLIADKRILLALIHDGRLRLRQYARLTLRILANGDTVVTTGNETSEMDGVGAGMMMYCSYMNFWKKRGKSWQLIGRHVGLISRAPVDPESPD